MKLSVVVPCFNAADTIGAQLEALETQRCPWPWEVVISDNGSTDRTVNAAKEFRSRLPSLTVVDSSSRRGPAYARNAGVKAASGDALLFCDADDMVGDGWLEAMGNALSEHEFIACRMDLKRLNKGNLDRIRSDQESRLQRLWYPPYLPHAGGGTIGVRRDVFEEFRGFDETLPVLEDTDFCIRLQLAGIELHFVPEAVICIRARTTLWGNFRQQRNYAEYNVLLAKKYASSGRFIGHPWKRRIRAWYKLLLGLPEIRDSYGRVKLARQLGKETGILAGAIKFRSTPV